MRIFVIDTEYRQLMPCTRRKARKLLTARKAAVYSFQPFTIVLHSPVKPNNQPMQLKLDPGSKVSGIALVATFAKRGLVCIWAANLHHRGQQIRNDILSRAANRRARRSRKTRYRKPRFDNRTRPKGQIPPSLKHRVLTTVSIAKKLLKFTPVSSLAVESVKFDYSLLELYEKDITLSHLEPKEAESIRNYAKITVRAFLLEKYSYKCVYCDDKANTLHKEHIESRAIGGSNRLSNLVLACKPCNVRKGKMSIDDFLADKPERLKAIKAKLKKGLKDAAAVNTTRLALVKALEELELPVTTSNGVITSFNRRNQGYPKDHWIDAACVGNNGSKVILDATIKPLVIKAVGHGNRQMTRVDKYGFPRTKTKASKRVEGFQTGDLVRLSNPKGKYAGEYISRLTGIRARGYFTIKANEAIIDNHSKHFKLLQKGDGYAYS